MVLISLHFDFVTVDKLGFSRATPYKVDILWFMICSCSTSQGEMLHIAAMFYYFCIRTIVDMLNYGLIKKYYSYLSFSLKKKNLNFSGSYTDEVIHLVSFCR